MKTLIKAFVFAFIFSLFVVLLSAASDKTYMKQGAKLYAAKNYNAAYSAFEKAAKANHKNYQAYIYMAYCRLGMRDRRGAISNLEKALKIKDNPALRKYVQMLIYGKRAPAEPYYYSGGLNRTEALGSPKLVLPDMSTALDLYGGAANTAGLAMRPKKNFISAGLNFWDNWQNISASMLGIGISGKANIATFLLTGDLGQREDAATYWLTNDDVLSADFMFANISTSVSESTSGFPLPIGIGAQAPATALITNIEYARKITNLLSAGAILGYEGAWFGNISMNSPLGTAYEKSTGNKINWGLSVAYLPDIGYGKVTTGISISDTDEMTKAINFFPWASTFASVPTDYIDLMNANTEEVASGGGMSMDIKNTTSVSGVNTAISGSLVKDTLEILARTSLTLGINANVTGTETDTNGGLTTKINMPAYNSETGGATFGIMLKARYGIGMFDLGLGIEGFNSGYKSYAMPNDPNPVSVSIGYFRLVGGTTFKPTSMFSIPFELFYEGTGYSDKSTGNTDSTSYATIGVNAGCEFKLSTELTLRGGLLYLTTGTSTVANGTAGPSSGSVNNPSSSRSGISVGAGYLFKPIQFDAVLGFYMDGMGPLPQGVSYSSDNIEAAVSALIPL